MFQVYRVARFPNSVMMSSCAVTRCLIGTSFLTNFYSSNILYSCGFLILFSSHVTMTCFFSWGHPVTDVGKFRRGCLLKFDMRSGDMARTCRGRLSIGNLQGHTPCVMDCVPSRATSRPTIWFKIITSVTVVTHFRSAPIGVHVCLRRHTFLHPSSCNTFAAASNPVAVFIPCVKDTTLLHAINGSANVLCFCDSHFSVLMLSYCGMWKQVAPEWTSAQHSHF